MTLRNLRPRWAVPLAGSSALILALGISVKLGWSFGSVADWVEAIGTVGALLVAARVLQVEQRNRIADQRERQARDVTGHVDWTPGGESALVLTVTNASSLPVRDVRGCAYRVDDPDAEPLSFPTIPVAEPGTTKRTLWVDSTDISVRLEIEFDDDAAVTWRKLGDPWLQEIDKETRQPVHGGTL